jgi:hypothetical protein
MEKNEHNTLGSILEQTLINARKKYEMTSCMSEFEKSVLREIEDMGAESYGMNDSEIQSNLEKLTDWFWKRKLQ